VAVRDALPPAYDNASVYVCKGSFPFGPCAFEDLYPRPSWSTGTVLIETVYRTINYLRRSGSLASPSTRYCNLPARNAHASSIADGSRCLKLLLLRVATTTTCTASQYKGYAHHSMVRDSNKETCSPSFVSALATLPYS